MPTNATTDSHTFVSVVGQAQSVGNVQPLNSIVTKQDKVSRSPRTFEHEVIHEKFAIQGTIVFLYAKAVYCVVFDDSARVRRESCSIRPMDPFGCVRLRSGARLVAPRVKASWWELLAPIHHSELVSIVPLPLHVQLNFPGRGFGWNK